MSDQLAISNEIKAFVQGILSEKLFDSTAEIKYFPGSEIGDGYGSKTLAVNINDETKSLHLFLKCALTTINIKSLHSIYETEIKWYKTIYPAYQKFLADKKIKNGFNNVPLCYGVLEKTGSETVALENLRARSFTLFDRFTFMNYEHLKLTLETFAKFHAVSFALKDQQREVHDDYIGGRPNIILALKDLAFEKIISNMVSEFVSKLDPIEDEDILRKSEHLASRVLDQFLNMERYLNDYSILTKGDCWVNNMMILYKDENKLHPIDVMLIDWQGITRGSPVHDIGGVVLAVSSEETLNDFNHYLSLYYEELSKRIRELGSDPDQLYPFEVFINDWKEYGLYIFGTAVIGVNVMLVEKENAPVLEGMNDYDVKELATATEQVFTKLNNNEEQVLHTLTGHSGKVLAAKFLGEPSKVVTGSHDRTLKIWDLRSRACIETKFAGSSCNDLVTADGSGSTIISGHFDKRIRFWDTRSESGPNEIVVNGKVTSLDMTRDAKYLVACVRDDTLKLLDLRMNQVVLTFSHEGFKVGCDWARATFSPDGQYIAVGSADGSVFIWGINTAKVETILKEHTSAVTATAWHPYSALLVSVDKAKKAVVWTDV